MVGVPASKFRASTHFEQRLQWLAMQHRFELVLAHAFDQHWDHFVVCVEELA
jgi:hypothetical protein